MLVNFHKLGQSFVAKILFGVLILSFVGWGISDVFRQTAGSNNAAKVGSVKIPLVELDHSYRQYISNLRARGIEITSTQARSMQLAESVLKAKIQRELFNLAADDLNLHVGDDIVAREIKKQKAFQNEKGEFDRNLYNATLKNNNLREADYVAGLRLDTINNFLAANLKNNAVVPDTLVNEIYRQQSQTRSAELRIIPYASVTGAVPKPDELAKYLADHAEHYKMPELRQMTVAILSTAEMAQKISVSDDEIKAAYDEYKENLKTPEERTIQFISLPDQKLAQRVAESARGGQKLLDAAKSEGGKDVKLNTLDNVKPGTLPDYLDQVIFKMGRAETSDAINTPLGWYVVQILAVKQSTVPTLAEAKDKVIKGIKINKLNETLPKSITAMDDSLAGGASLDELSKNYPLHITQLGAVSQDGMDENGTPVKFAQLADVMKISNDLPTGQASSPAELKNGDYIIVRVDEVKAAHVPELKDIQNKVSADWLNDNKEKIAGTRAEELKAAWQNNKDFDALAKKYDAQTATLANVRRDSAVADNRQSPDLLLALFDLKAKGDIATGKVKSGIVVAKLTGISDAGVAKPEALTVIRDKLTEDAANAQFDLFLAATEKHNHVTINQDAVQRLYQTN